MTPRRKLVLAVVALAIYIVGGLVLLVVALLPGLESDERGALREAFFGQPAVLIVLGLFFLAGLALLVRLFFTLYVTRAVALTEQARLMGSVNPGHRIAPGGPVELRELAAAINELGRRYQALEEDVGRRVRNATLDLQEDRDRVAAVMAQLSKGVLVCDGEGRILLYNDAAKAVLGGGEDDAGSGEEALVGLGRSVFALFDRTVVMHALAGASRHAGRAEVTPVRRIASTATGGKPVRLEVAPVQERREAGGGFLLVVEPVGPAADVPPPAGPARSSLDEILARDAAVCVQASLERDVGVAVTDLDAEDNLWLEVDVLELVAVVARVAAQVRAELGIDDVAVRVYRSGSSACLDLVWDGAAPDAERVASWPGEMLPVADAEPGKACGRLVLTTAQAEPDTGQQGVDEGSARPLFFDFDLFGAGRRKPEWDALLLSELVYTIFDLETTGLDPSGGDEIVSIGAVRVAGGRLLREETFDRLVDPRRPISAASLRTHGISAEVLKGRPPITEVLPSFALFAEESVLVGHNVAFDMRFLELKEDATGVRFAQPVLDTLLLASVVHPASDDHSLEALAERLGLPVAGRHSALADAVLTAEILLKLVPLLAEDGILTLEDALEASRATTLAKLSY